jgi:hypothetical protein
MPATVEFHRRYNNSGIDSYSPCSLFVLMAVETIGEAWQLGWRITARSAFGNSDGMRSIRSCIYQYDLDLKPLIWTRGATFPLSNLATRLKCLSCGSRRVALVFHMPREPQSVKARVVCAWYDCSRPRVGAFSFAVPVRSLRETACTMAENSPA